LQTLNALYLAASASSWLWKVTLFSGLILSADWKTEYWIE